jgi:hypothetical protein
MQTVSSTRRLTNGCRLRTKERGTVDTTTGLLVVGAALVALVTLWVGYLIGRVVAAARFRRKIPEVREDAVKRSRAVLGGQLTEQLAPYLPDFPWSATEVRFLGKPIDFLVFRGMDGKAIEEVVFVEVKTGESRLSPVERTLRDAIQAGRVSWAEWRGPKAG